MVNGPGVNLNGKVFVSVIIPVYNDTARLVKCLEALALQTCPGDSYEVIVVDNGRNEGIEEITARFAFVRLLRETKPGAEAARNTGIAAARGAVLAFTDSDCVPAPEWLEKGTEKLLEKPGRGQVAGGIRFTFKNESRRNIYEIYDSYTGFKSRKYIEEEHFAAGANFFIFKDAIVDAGLFDGSLLLCGDYDLGQRVHAKGYGQAYSDEAWVAHPARSTFRAICGKHMRIAGGHYSINTELALIERTRQYLIETAKALADPALGGPAVKLRFLILDAAMKAAGFFELARLVLGGKPKR